MRLVGFSAFAAGVALLPLLFPNNYFVTVVGVSAGLHVILAVGLNLRHGGGVTAPEQGGATGCGLNHRQRGAEGAGADYADHALAPLRPEPSMGAA